MEFYSNDYISRMNLLNGIHHIAIICSDYEKSKAFYTKILGFTIIREVYREERQSYKLDLALGDKYLIPLPLQDPPSPKQQDFVTLHSA